MDVPAVGNQMVRGHIAHRMATSICKMFKCNILARLLLGTLKDQQLNNEQKFRQKMHSVDEMAPNDVIYFMLRTCSKA